jgi:acyl carrier protein
MKVNGYRVEAGEVETRLLAHPQVKQAAVVRQHGVHGDRLVAHLAAAGEERPADSELQQMLRRHLPGYMIPSVIVWHDGLPLTGNRKVDRRALEAAELRSAPSADVVAAPEIERAVGELWMSVLRVNDVGSTSNLYELGGDSIAAIRILTAVRKRFSVTIPLDLLPEVDTVHKMAARIGATVSAS